MAFVSVEDLYGTTEIIVFDSCYNRSSDVIIEDNIVLIEGRLSIREDEDIYFLDPPYASGLLEKALTEITRFDICREHGIIVAESAEDTVLPTLAPPYSLYREYRYGKIKLTVYHRSGNEDENP